MRTKSYSLLVVALCCAFAGCSSKDTSDSAKNSASSEAAKPSIKTFELTAGDNMKFNMTEIAVAPGEKVKITLANVGSMPKEAMAHNWILLKAGSDPQAYANSAVTAKAEGYQPASLADQVIAVIPLQGPKQTGEITFTAPTQPGEYPFLCSFPAHYIAGMQGKLVVR